VGVECLTDHPAPPGKGVAVTTTPDHRALAVGYFNQTWALLDAGARTAEHDRDILTTAFASRRHWIDAGGTDDNIVVADWQVAHAASLAGFADVAAAFSEAAYDRARAAGLETWLQASTAEGRARACAAAGDADGYQRFADEARELLAKVEDDDDRRLIESQLAAIPVP
jgi:hypothetical protein